jgi:hypothetical protein
MNKENKSNNLEPKKNGWQSEQSQAQKQYQKVLSELRINALNQPVIDPEQASDNHQLMQLDGMYFIQLGVGISFEKHYAVDWFERFPYWHSEIVLIKQKNGLYVPTFLRTASLIKPKIVNAVKQGLYESLNGCGDVTREELITKPYGCALKRPLLPREFLKLPDYAKEYSDYHFEEYKEEK